MTAYLSLQIREEVAQYFSSAEIKYPKLYIQRKYPSELRGNQDPQTKENQENLLPKPT